MKKLSVEQTHRVMWALVIFAVLFTAAVVIHRIPIVWNMYTHDPYASTTTTVRP